ncbi:MAG: DUF3299 domain-containing protein [Hyphomicrobiales bacterium]
MKFKTITRTMLAAVFAVSTLSAAAAKDLNEISWDDLVPPRFSQDSPLASLTPEQQSDLQFINQVEQYKKAGITDDENGYVEVAKEIEGNLRGMGLDVDTLLAETRKAAAKEVSLVKNLDGKSVRIPGYVLPLEADGDTVKEFLLVPYVGACIHTPPPPENQIVYVKLDKGVKISRMYEPVWATGVLNAKQSKRELSFVDGSDDIAVGYQLNGTAIEPYEFETQ